ncbi:rod shape-determining protein MreC [Sphingobacterium rhinopitheci]|uniref:rod shape-determining protein MreC n=1 Tax=Sphingobacterium rhinopitheci TaxID=2781960 RepID=UPI001F525C1D|nr:rod shape-determining protein MreC [Sphingobacterium rhinopitheci]MCI0919861.1 rod shape-determining protein MreC [Sphingobacterium rhinopitheci]
MKNLWLFFVRFNAFFWFLLFFTFSIVLVIRNNNYQQSAFINSSNIFVGTLYTKFNSWQEYINLSKDNELLTAENAALRQRLQFFEDSDSTVMPAIKLTMDEAQYEFIPANVINNSISQKNNFITLNKGIKDGIEPNMGVISSNGVVGTVLKVSENFCTVTSLLNSATKISVSLDSTSETFGSLVWGNNIDSRYAMVKDIPNHIKAYVGQPLFTSGYSTKFPKGIKVGHILETDLTSGGSFKDMRVLLTTNFSNLTHVYIVKDKLAKEKIELESSNNNNG